MPQLMTDQGIIRVPAGTWIVDPVHSSVAFEAKHMMIATVRGQFREFDGQLEAAEDDPANSRVEGLAKVASIDTGNDDRDAHLRGPDFFDAERYPDIRFRSTRITHVEGGHYRVAGDLTIKEITGEDPWGNERVGIAVRGTVNRNDFGLTWQQALPSGGLLVGEQVKVMIDVSAIRAS
jgi:polyisoprenoid-binding protein YceI